MLAVLLTGVCSSDLEITRLLCLAEYPSLHSETIQWPRRRTYRMHLLLDTMKTV